MTQFTCMLLGAFVSLIGIFSAFAGIYFFLIDRAGAAGYMFILWLFMSVCSHLLITFYKNNFGEFPLLITFYKNNFGEFPF